MIWILWIYLINTACMMVAAVREARRPAVALSILLVSLILPILGFIFYLVVSNPKRKTRPDLNSGRTEGNELPKSFGHSAVTIAHALRHLAVDQLRQCHVNPLINGTETYHQLLHAIQHAKHSIDIEYYIFRDDQIGQQFTDALIERANAGLRVRFIRDGMGSRRLPNHQLQRLADAGVVCRTFFPLRFPRFLSNFNYRDHCKIVIIDQVQAFTGGINIGDEYTGEKRNVGFWRDTHVRLLGDSQRDLQAIFDAHWALATPERVGKRVSQTIHRSSRPSFTTATITKNSLLANLATEFGATFSTSDTVDVTDKSGAVQNVYVHTFEGNPMLSTPVVREMYFTCLTQAAKTIDITTPYFIPEADITMALKTAAARGVRVRLLVPHHVDQKIVGAASRTYYGELVEAGVHVYLYDKGVLHAKTMVIDEEIVEVGAANYDVRSFRLNYEVCQVMYGKELANMFTQQFEEDLEESILLRVEDLQNRSARQRMVEQGARLLAPFL